MEAIKKLIEIALREEGYHEKVSGDQLDHPTANAGDQNFTKYARDLNRAGFFNGSKQGCEWCTSFVVWAFFQLCGSRELTERVLCFGGPYAASCGWASDYYKDAGRLDRKFRVGDQIFFGDFAHTGIVVDIRGGRIYTIEGNSDNRVQRHSYDVHDPRVNCVGHPRYDLVPVEEPKPVAPGPDPEKAPEEILEHDRRYDAVEEVPGFAKATITKMLNKGLLKGRADGDLDLSDDMVRIYYTIDKTGLFGD